VITDYGKIVVITNWSALTVPFRPQVQSPVTSDPELNLFAKLSRSQVAHEHAAKQGAYLLLLNVILTLIFLPSVVASYCMSCSQMPFSQYVHEQTVLQHTLISHFVTIFRAMNLCHELENFPSWITLAYEPMNLGVQAITGHTP
jgi:hypothetical protein